MTEQDYDSNLSATSSLESKSNLKFAHLADCHIGGWREQKLRDLNFKSFQKAIQLCKENSVDFIIISGDLFNTSFPPLHELKKTVKVLKNLLENQIPVYVVAGSHDYSPSGKTILDVLEEAGLIINVCKGQIIEGKLKLNFTIDKKTKVKLTGMIGKRGMLEKTYYEGLDTDSLISETGFKIFLFHTTIDELKPAELSRMEGSPVSLLPKGFDYYAGGHVHIVEKKSLDGYANLCYPGPTFPNSFSELEKLKTGGFYIYDSGVVRWQNVVVCNVETFFINGDLKTPTEIESEIFDLINSKEFYNSLVLFRVQGKLKEGRPGDVNWKKIFELVIQKGAIFVLKNANKLVSKEFEEIKVIEGTTEEVENKLICEHVGQLDFLSESSEKQLVNDLINILQIEKEEGEKSTDYENRVIREANMVINENLF
ncbi:DNA repair exonuclease [Candidatus Woesearchaeota archaeon]|mgnify:CR=1 FL=1|jgi:DNA repair protein SbcD/Mre11|nr:DNA repair exonuclease [Candidatus Woesearchaeota archaeon]